MPYEQAVQTKIDTATRSFLLSFNNGDYDAERNIQPFDQIAQIRNMPLTQITEPQVDQVAEIIDARLLNKLWLRRFDATFTTDDPLL